MPSSGPSRGNSWKRDVGSARQPLKPDPRFGGRDYLKAANERISLGLAPRFIDSR
jgi:hypothetical protein